MIEKILASKFVTKNQLLLGLFLCLTTFIFIYRTFLFSNNYFAFVDIGSDTSLSYIPYLKYISRRFLNGDFSMYSFELGIGTSLYSASQLIFDPFNIPLFILGSSYVETSQIYICAVKMVLIFVVSFNFFKFKNFSGYLSLIGAMLLTFNGFSMLWGQHYFFLTGYFYTILLLFTFERLLGTGKWLGFSLTIAAFFSFSYYFFYISAVFIIIYYAFSLLRKGSSVFLSKTHSFIYIAITSILGVLLSLVFSLPTVLYVIANPRVSGNSFSFPASLDLAGGLTYFYRIFSNDSLSAGSFYYGTDNYYAAPNLYSTVLIFLTLPLLFLQLSKKGRLLFLLTLFAVVWGIYTNLISAVTNLFSILYSRWTYLFIIGVISVSILSIRNQIKKQHQLLLPLLVSFLFFLGYFSFPRIFPDVFKWNHDFMFQLGVRLVQFLAIYFFIFYLHKKKILTETAFLFSLLLVVSVEITWSHYRSLTVRSLLNSNYRNEIAVLDSNFPSAVDAIKKVDHENYRIASDQINFLVEPILYNYLGLTEYCSLSDPYYVKLLSESEPKTSSFVVVKGPISNWQLADFLGVKYYISTSGKMPWPYYDLMDTKTKYKIFKNQKALPLIQSVNVNEVVDFKKIILGQDQTSDGLAQLQSNSASSPVSNLKISSGEISGLVKSSQAKLVFFTVPFSRSWQGYVNGIKIKPELFADAFPSFKVDAGESEVRLKYHPQGLDTGFWLTLIAGITLILMFIFNSKWTKFFLSHH